MGREGRGCRKNTPSCSKNTLTALFEVSMLEVTRPSEGTVTAELFWAGFGGVVGGAGAITAVVQIILGKRDAKRQAAFEHIRSVEERLQRVYRISSIAQARGEALRFYKREVKELTNPAADYLAYLTALDLLIFACKIGSVDRSIASTWLRGELRQDDTLSKFIEELQDACGDPSCFEYLGRHLKPAAKKVEPGQKKTVTVQGKEGANP
jgi:hypothetical protein